MSYCKTCGQAEYHPPGTCPYDEEVLGRAKTISDDASDETMNFFSPFVPIGGEINKSSFEDTNLDL